MSYPGPEKSRPTKCRLSLRHSLDIFLKYTKIKNYYKLVLFQRFKNSSHLHKNSSHLTTNNTSNIEHQTSNIKHQTTSNKREYRTWISNANIERENECGERTRVETFNVILQDDQRKERDNSFKYFMIDVFYHLIAFVLRIRSFVHF